MVSLPQAGNILGLPVSGVEALIDAGYLIGAGDGQLRASDLKAFLARNSPRRGDAVSELFTELDGVDVGVEEILHMLEASIADMARRAADIMAGAFPEAAAWTPDERRRFEDDAAQRFEAIIAVTRAAQGQDNGPLLEELTEVGGAAAFADVPLPQLLVIFRVARDLMVQSAVRAAENLGQEWGLSLSVVLTKVLPTLDRLADSLAIGYWSALINREHETLARFEHVVEQSASGVFEIDLDGVVQYANPAMARLCCCSVEQLTGRRVLDVLDPIGADLDAFTKPTPNGWRLIDVDRGDGDVRTLRLSVTARRQDGHIVGFDGVIQDLSEPEPSLQL